MHPQQNENKTQIYLNTNNDWQMRKAPWKSRPPKPRLSHLETVKMPTTGEIRILVV